MRAVALLIGVSFRTDPWRSIGVLVEPLGMLSTPLFALFLKLITDGVLAQDVRLVAVAVAGLSATHGIRFLAGWTGSWMRVRLMEEVGFSFDKEITTLTSSLPGLEHHEIPEYQDRLELLRRGQGQLGLTLNALIYTTNAAVSGIGALVMLALISPWLLALLLFIVPAVPLASFHQRWLKAAEEASAAPSRLARHLRGLTADRDAGMELRVFGLQDEIVSRYRAAWLASRRPVLTAERRATVLGSIRELVYAVAFAGAVGFVLWQASTGRATVGDVVMAAYLCQRLQRQVVGPIQAVAGLGGVLRTARRMLWLRDYAQTWAERRRNGPVPDHLTGGIVFEHVSFRYPGTVEWALRDVSVSIPAGAVVALVGENGAGKTTIVKLLSRMYEPTEGRILVNGIDLTGIDVDAWRAQLSAAFQDFARLELTAQHSVGVGSLPHLDNVAMVSDALDRAGATEVLPQLPNSHRTQLGSRWEDGVDLSTGQWQKLALGRALMRTGPLLTFFDEPTASLDPPTEHALFERYAAAARSSSKPGAITVLVSHRFSTVRSGDLILVLEDGHIAELGDHDSLIARRGLYAELYTMQAASYR